MTDGKYKAVLFDMGGVVTKISDLVIIKKILARVAKIEELKNVLFAFEEGEVTLEEVADVADLHLGDVLDDSLENVLKREFLAKEDENVHAAIRELKKRGFRVGLLTNNGFFTQSRTSTTIIDDVSMFDFVVESCKIGYRKPNAEFFHTALKIGGLNAEECIFIDDLRINCIGAENAGLTAINLVDGDSETAIDELERLLNIKLLQ